MIELVIVYCMISEASRCVEVRQPQVAYESATACSSAAQLVAQSYLSDHPKWTLSRWRCEIDLPRQQPA